MKSLVHFGEYYWFRIVMALVFFFFFYDLFFDRRFLIARIPTSGDTGPELHTTPTSSL